MFKIIEGKRIELTRGDIASFKVEAIENNKPYEFQAGEIVRFKVYEKNDCKCVKLLKDVTVEKKTTSVDINLESKDTKGICNYINSPKEYWFEVELNPETAPQTIVGYDKEPAVFKLLPEGGEVNE